MKTRCDYCDNPFGMVRRRFGAMQFCSEPCENQWLAKRNKAIADFKRWLYGSPARGSPTN